METHNNLTKTEHKLFNLFYAQPIQRRMLNLRLLEFSYKRDKINYFIRAVLKPRIHRHATPGQITKAKEEIQKFN